MGFSRNGVTDPKPVVKKVKSNNLVKDLVKSGVVSKKVKVNDTRRKVFKRVSTMSRSSASSIENKFPKGIKIAYLPSLSQVRVRVQAEGKLGNGKDTLERIDEACRLITDVLGESVYGWDDDSLQEVVGQMLRGKNLKLTLAESCTGGYLGHMITSVPGSSDYFVGSIISYSNDLKMAELDVPAIVLKEHGAVSEETVRYMAKGALRRYKADIALSVSGIAGPDGGSEEKPVGTVWMCVTNGENTKTAKLQLSKTRTLNIEQASIIGLNMIRKFLLGLEMA